MKILILRSIPGGEKPGPYTVRMDTAYARRVIGHLSDTGDYCSTCGSKCRECRREYPLDHTGSIAGIINFPSILPALLDEPEEYLPSNVPEYDILLALGIHEQILLAFANCFPISRGIIVPQERSDWLSPYAIDRLRELGGSQGIETAFPKPFCSFNPKNGILKTFKEEFRIGRPEFEMSVSDGKIQNMQVGCSAPCGASYYVARHLPGLSPGEELILKADMLLSAYPCTADHAIDREFNDSITHQAVKIQARVLEDLILRECPSEMAFMTRSE
ncbi:hypothetical protein HQ585_07580 [candidate division KSB1 bacterium]|nr:hypothetical protein [candidate division KSB1 bacterium]